MSDELVIWTITYRPRDLPGIAFAARAHRISPSSTAVLPGPALTADSLEAIRALLPPGLFNLGRADEDDPGIVESWI